MFLVVLLIAPFGVALAQSNWEPVQATAKRALPAHLAALQSLPVGSVSEWRRGADSKRGESWALQLPDGRRYTLQLESTQAHANGDLSHSGSMVGADGRFQVFLTEGREASFGSFDTPSGRFRFEAHGDSAWLIDLGHPALREGDLAAPLNSPGFAAPPPPAPKSVQVTIDLLVLYSEGFAARYPGEIAQTRVNHLVALTNRIFADSGLSLGLRLVGTDPNAYPDSEGPNATLLQRMRAALLGQSTHPALANLRNRRTASGADLVTFLRPHDIETRGNCGIAYLFGGGASNGVNVVSDGFSSWSLCADEVLAHEVGHNLGAEHQNGANSANAGFGTAHVLPGRLNTLMGSFGTGQPDRFRRLLRFSNPAQRCGGQPCGVPGLADNARRVRDTMAAVAAYSPERSTLPRPQALLARDPDTDGDGVPDSEDAFPFDPRYTRDRDGDGVPDELDAFPDDPSEWADTNGNGIGDNRDPDIDGDGVPNASDAFPLDPTEWADSDGDGVGDNSDAFPLDPTEWRDTDRDGVGDNIDPDRDGDGRPDLQAGPGAAAFDLLVASLGTDRLVRLRADSGRFAGIEIAKQFTPVALGSQSSFAWDAGRKRLLGLVSTELRAWDRATGALGTVAQSVPGGPRPALASAFPTGLAVEADGTVFVADDSTLRIQRVHGVTGQRLPLGSFEQANLLQSAPRGLSVGVPGRLWSLERNGRVLELDTASGAVLRSLQPSVVDGPALANPTAIAFDAANNRILVACAATDRVLWMRADGSGGLQTLVAAGSGGLRAPAGLAIGPDGRLYVSSAGSDEVLRFDAADGRFVDVFSRVPPGRLREPRGLVFVPRVADRFPLDGVRELRPTAATWYDPDRPGQGWDVQINGNRVSLLWYTYAADATPTWYLASGALVGSEMQAPWLRFEWVDGRAVAEEVGQLHLRFDDEESARLDWRLGETTGSERIVPLWLGGTVETSWPTAAWYAPEQDGWGLSVTRGGDVLTAIAFIYDAQGRPTWVAGSAPFADGQANVPLLRFSSSALCPGCSGDASLSNAGIGQLRFNPGSGGAGSLDIEVIATGTDWRRSGLPLRPLSESPTRPNGDP
ncbi:MAG: M12 family metallo-peptidase [Aquimonas sp.]|nr:M12 family metallo-peptidase [Aquimonas sp.]